MADIIRTRRDTAANWAGINPILGLGERGHERDTGLSKTGDGSKRWNDLDYESGGIGSARPVNVFPTRAAFLAARIPASLDVVAYLDGDQQIDMVRDPSGLAATTADGSKWNPVGPVASLRAFGMSAAAADNGPAWQAAVTWNGQAPGRRLVDYSGATYEIASGAYTQEDVDIEGDFLIYAKMNSEVLKCEAAVEEFVPLTADYVPGSIDLAVSMTTPLRAGRWVKILSNAINPNSRDAGPKTIGQKAVRSGRWIKVGNSSTTSIVKLVQPLQKVTAIDPAAAGTGDRIACWTTAMGARLAVPVDHRCRLRGFRVTYEPGHEGDGWGGHSLSINGYTDFEARNISQDFGYGPALSMATVNARTYDCDFRNLISNPAGGQLGYGIHDNGHGNKHYGLTGSNCRHVYTTSQMTSIGNVTVPAQVWRQGSTTDCQVIGANAQGGLYNGDEIVGVLDTHNGAEGIEFIGCTVTGAQRAMTSRGQNIRIKDFTTRQCGMSVLVFTGQSADDGYPLSAGKLVEDFGSIAIDGLDAEAFDQPLEAWTATMTVRNARIRSSEIQVFGGSGRMYLGGNIDVQIDTLDGAYPVWRGPDGKRAVFSPRSNLAFDRGLIGVPIIHVLPGCSVKIDARIPDGTGTPSKLMEPSREDTVLDDVGRLIVEGTIDIALPADGVLWPAEADVECRGDGLIRWSLEAGGSYATSAANVAAKPVRVLSDDGSIWWDRATKQLPGERVIFASGNLGVTHSAASENTNIYSPPVAAIQPYLVAGDVVTYELIGKKVGGGGTCVLTIRSGGSFNDSYTLPAETCFFRLTAVINITSTTAQECLFEWQVGTNAADPDATRTHIRSRELNLASASTLFQVGAAAVAGSDVITLVGIKVKSTAGGGKLS